MTKFIFLFLSLFAFITAPGAMDIHAQTGPSAQKNGAIHIESDSMEAMDQTGKIVFKGNVAATRDDLTINSDILDVIYSKAPGAVKENDTTKRAVKTLVARGHVRITIGKRMATGEKAVYDKKAEIITISGSAQAWDGPNRIKGETIIMFVNEDRSIVKGSAKEKVEAVVYPNE
jgi:lipopolysaccharide export system protein LptA